MNYMFSFEKLKVWQEAKDLVLMVYKLTSHFPPFEKYGLVSQLRRASISVSSNIAEGNTRITNKDKAHFSSMAYSSLMEVLSQLIISKELDFIADQQYFSIREQIHKVSYKLVAFRNFQQSQ